MEKAEAARAFRRISDSKSPSKQIAEEVRGPEWQPGYWARFPTIGVGALVLVFLSTCTAVMVLVLSDQRSSSQWTTRLAPNVVLSAINSFSSMMLAVAVAQGFAIAWWVKALRGATVSELHRSWAYTMSIGKILEHIWALDAIALAALALKLAIVDGILFQRATSAYTTQDPPRNITLLGAAVTEFPQTGFVVSEGFGAQTDCGCFMIGDTYTPVVNTWETSNGFFKGYNELFDGCDGICFTHVDAIGFEADCSSSKDTENLATAAIAAWEANANGTKKDPARWTDLPIFNSSFSMSYAKDSTGYASINMDLLYFQSENPYDPNSASCPGTTTQVRCTLRPAIVRYPVNVVNYSNPHITNGVSVGGTMKGMDNTNSPDIPTYSYSNKQAEGFQVLRYLQPSELPRINSTSHLGGIANALSQFLSSSASITYMGSSLWGLKQYGTLAQTMMYGPPNMGSCDCSFRDALSTLVAGINQLTFLTATGLIDRQSYANATIEAGTAATVVGVRDNITSTFQALDQTQQVSDVIHYQTHYLFVYLGAGCMLLCILLVIPSFWRYGELGRDVSLGPMEIASAFRAPMLDTGRAEAAGDVHQLIKEVGNRKVMYGFVDVRNSVADGAGNKQNVMLAMEEPTRVRPVTGMWSNPPSPKL